MRNVAPLWRAAALTLPLIGSTGCDWIPVRRRLDPSLYPVPSRASRLDPAHQGSPRDPGLSVADRENLPPLPELVPVSAEEALASPPTPLLDAALVRAEAIQKAAFDEPAEPAPPDLETGLPPGRLIVRPVTESPAATAPAESPRPSKPAASSPPAAPSPRSTDLIPLPKDDEIDDQPEADTRNGSEADTTKPMIEDERPDRASIDEPAPAPPDGTDAEPSATPEPHSHSDRLSDATPNLDPGEHWRIGLENLLALSRNQATRDGETSEVWAARQRVLDMLADSEGNLDEATLWETVMTMLAESDAPPDTLVLEPPPDAGDDASLDPTSSLRVTNLALCRQVITFGRFETIDPQSCLAGQDVILYCELEGVHYEPFEESYRSRLSTSLTIVPDEGGPAVWSDVRPAIDTCNRPRRDYYVSYWITLPSSIPPGRYHLVVAQDDLLTDQSATRSLDFTVRPPQ